jgi:hypothetical protein
VRKPIPESRCRQSYELERIRGCDCGVRHLAKRRYERNVPKDSPVREKPTVLLDVSDFPAQRYRGLRANVSVPDSYLSTQRFDEPVEAAEKSRLTRSTLTDQGKGAAGWNNDAYVIECDHGAEAV